VIVNNAMFPLAPSYTGVQQLQQQFNTLQTQLATGEKASTLSGYGPNLSSALNLRSQISQLAGYDTNIGTVNLRLDTMNSVLSSLATVQTSTEQVASPGVYGTNNISLTTAPTQAQQNLDQVLASLNTDLNGHYLFGGSAVDQPPVASMDTIMNGSGSLAGFNTVAAQRLQADQGTDNMGRLTLSTTADTVTLGQDNTNFGYSLSGVTTSNPSAITLTQPSGTPPSLSVQFASQPTAGDTVGITLTLPDGSTDTMNLTAVAGTPAAGQFQVGADTSATAANFQAALQSSIQADTPTKLAAASNYAAAEGFFNGSGESVQRVAIDPVTNSYATATGYETAAQTASDTVQWYSGENSASSAASRASVSTKVDSTVNLNYGVEANESGITQLVRSLAVQAIQTYPTTDDATTAASQAKFDIIANDTQTDLSEASDSSPGSLTSIGVDLGLAQSTLSNLSDQHSAYSTQLQNIIANNEQADPNEVASELLQVQTQLEASYSAMSMVSQLQLANYLQL
jgi:flagellin-like hook-associated protein FlgL